MTTMTAIGQIRALLVPLMGEGGVWRRSHLPEDQPLPYVTISEVSTTPRLAGDGASVLAHEELVQVDLWQRAGEEDLRLVDKVCDSLNSKKMAGTYLRVMFEDVALIPESEVIHHAVTCRVARIGFIEEDDEEP